MLFQGFANGFSCILELQEWADILTNDKCTSHAFKSITKMTREASFSLGFFFSNIVLESKVYQVFVKLIVDDKQLENLFLSRLYHMLVHHRFCGFSINIFFYFHVLRSHLPTG